MTTSLIANLALDMIGAESITGIDENSPNAETCRKHYDLARRTLLRSAPWSFAIRRLSTARTASDFGVDWKYAYQMPPTCAQVLDVNGVNTEDSSNPGFAIEGGQILCDAEECVVRYVHDETDPNAFPDDFTACLTCLLAGKIAAKITGNVSMGVELETKAMKELLPRGAAASANESRRRRVARVSESDLVMARFGYGWR